MTDWAKIEAETIERTKALIDVGVLSRENADAIVADVRRTGDRQRKLEALRERWRAADAIASDPERADEATEIRRAVMEDARALGIKDGIP